MTAAIHPQAIWPQSRPDAIFWSSAQRQTQTQSQTFQGLQQPQPQLTVVPVHEHQRQPLSTWQNAVQNPQHYPDSASASAVRLSSAPAASQVPPIFANAPLSISNKQIWSSPWDQQGQANVPEPSSGMSHLWQQMAPPCPVRADVPSTAVSMPVVGPAMPALNQYGVPGPSFGAVHPLAPSIEMESNTMYTAQAPLFAPRVQFATWQPARQLAPGLSSNREAFVSTSSYTQSTGGPTSAVNLPAPASAAASASASASAGCDYNEETMYSFVSSHAMRVMEPAVGRASAAEYFAFHKFVARTLSAVRLTRPTLFLALVLLDRHCSTKIKDSNAKLPGAMCSPRWLILAVSLMLANKLHDDNTYTNLSWSKATGLSLEDLNSGERAWLCASSHALYIGAGGLYSSDMDFSQEITRSSSGASASAWSYSDWDTAWHASTPSQTVPPSVQASPRTPSSLVVPEPISPYATCSFAPSPSHQLGFPTFPPGLIYN